MKKTILLAFMLLLFILSCSRNKLDNGQALQLLKESKIYPKVLITEIRTADPNDVSKLVNSPLEKSGIVTINEAQSLGDMGQTQIFFTEKATPWLIPASEEEKQRGVQRVKVAEEELLKVVNVQLAEDGKKAVAEYTTEYKNITPFSAFYAAGLKKEKKNKAEFIFQEGGWKLLPETEKH